jgi:hypothetical protein
VLAFSSAHRKSIAVDTFRHLPSELYYLKTGDPRYCTGCRRRDPTRAAKDTNHTKRMEAGVRSTGMRRR